MTGGQAVWLVLPDENLDDQGIVGGFLGNRGHGRLRPRGIRDESGRWQAVWECSQKSVQALLEMYQGLPSGFRVFCRRDGAANDVTRAVRTGNWSFLDNVPANGRAAV